MFLHFGDRRGVKETEAVAAPAAAGFRSTPRVNRLSAALLERRIIQKRIRSRVQNLSSERRRLRQITGDAADFVAAEKLIDEIVKDFGTLDIVVNNAGITRDTLLMRMSEQQWDDVMHTNLKSIFNISKFAIKPMMKARNGVFINLSSIVGINGNAGQANYSASKAGIIAFTKSLAKELGSRNIRANTIAPGFIETEMTGELSEEIRKSWEQAVPLKRAGSTEDVANLAVFLASDMSSYITGQTIQVCGGLLT